MKQQILFLAITTLISCNNNDKKNNFENTTVKEIIGDSKMNESSGNLKDKEDFLLTCAIDASNSLGGENREKVKQFCECAWEKSKGEYRGQVIATESKLKKDSVLSQCYEQAKK